MSATAAAIAKPTATTVSAVGGGETSLAGRNHELLPETLGVLVGELARHRIQVAQALDRHEERFVVVEARLAQRVNLAAQMVLEFLDVGGTNRLPSAEVLPPLPDALFQDRLVRHGSLLSRSVRPAVRAGSTAMRQMPRIA